MASPDEIGVRNLLDLPNEILGLIFNDLTYEQWNGTSLSSFRQTCQKAYDVASPAWLRRIRLSRPSPANKLKLVLDANEMRMNHVQSLCIEPETFATSVTNGELMLGLISRLPNLRHLNITDGRLALRRLEQFCSILNRELLANAFTELRECELYLGLHNSRTRFPLQTQHLFKAPKLVRLSLDSVDLRVFDGQTIPERSTALRTLKLSCCTIDEASLFAIFRKPQALESFEFYALERSDFYTPYQKEERCVMQLVLPLLAREAPCLSALKLLFSCGNNVQEMHYEDIFDFSQMKTLKNLAVGADCFLTARGDTHMWCPINIFHKLPDALESINIRAKHCGEVDMYKLSKALLDCRNAGHSLPGSLRQVNIAVDKTHMRPFDKDDQQKDDRLRAGIECFLKELSLPELIYTQIDRDSFYTWGTMVGRTCLHLFRKMTAKRGITADEVCTWTEMTWDEEVGQSRPCYHW